MYYQPRLSFTAGEVLVYLRKSRSDDPALSVEEVLEKHEIILDEWAEEYFKERVPQENKYREVVSGETLKERPEIQHILRLIESPKYKAVCVVEPQRLTRGDLEDIGRLMKLLKHTNTLIITPQRTYNLQDDYDWDAFERELKRGNDYLEYTKKILSRGKLLSVSQGNYIASIPPYGYDKIWISDGKRKCPTLKINEREADVVRMIFDLYVNKNMGRINICHYLDRIGIKPPRGEHWSPPALKDMLENVHYIGKVKWNYRKTVTIVKDSELVKTRPKAKTGDFLIYDGKHEGIISEKLYIAAQEKQGKNYRAKPNTKLRNPFAGMLFCKCGHAMSLRFYNKSGQPPRFLCTNQVHCNTGSCLYTEMVDFVSSLLRKYIADIEIRLKNNTDDLEKVHNKLIKNLEKQLNDLNAKELAQWEAQADPNPANRMPQDVFRQLNAKLIKEKQEVQQALSEAYESMPQPIDYEKKLARFRDALSALNDSSIEEAEKNRLLKDCIERINYDREKPQLLKREEGEKKGARLKTGANWSSTQIKITIELKV